MSCWFWDGEIILNYMGKPNVIISVLKWERWKQKRRTWDGNDARAQPDLAGFRDRKEPCSKLGNFWILEKARQGALPESLQKEASPALMLAQWDPSYLSDPQKGRLINLCFKSLILVLICCTSHRKLTIFHNEQNFIHPIISKHNNKLTILISYTL